MKNIDIDLVIDFTSEKKRSSTGISYIQAFAKDETGEIKLTFFGTDCAKAKPKKKFRITKGYITAFNGQLQLNTKKEHPIEWL